VAALVEVIEEWEIPKKEIGCYRSMYAAEVRGSQVTGLATAGLVYGGILLHAVSSLTQSSD